ncbi:MAG: sulfite exporter TauE/SafE family protein [Kiritimatiellae bacterium]|nr:sulfite exporter TauE/SafE family protein [Kiritimatiellia bacterium]
MEIVDIVIAGVIILLAGILQSAVGFGYALFATPLLVLLGIPLLSVIAMVTTCTMVQAVTGSWKLRSSVPWRLSLTSTAIRSTSLLIGLLLLRKLVKMDVSHIRLIIGTILCVIVIVQLLWRPHPVKKLHWIWAGLAFTASGILGGISGMGGPPLVLWAMAHDWSTKRTRGFFFATFATSVPIQIFFLCMMFDISILKDVGIGIMFMPLVLLGAVIGLPIGDRMSKARLRYLAYTILLIIGITAITPSLLAYLK